MAWERMVKLADEFLPKPGVLHPWPSVQFAGQKPEVRAECGNPAALGSVRGTVSNDCTYRERPRA